VKEHQWLDVGAWVYRNFNDCSGVSFFPVDDHIFEQAPYEPVGVAEYEQKKSEMPEKIDWYKLLSEAEKEDQGEGAREYACVSGACEL
jgi:ribonucleoside-diphosphate reductase alpha chain